MAETPHYWYMLIGKDKLHRDQKRYDSEDVSALRQMKAEEAAAPIIRWNRSKAGSACPLSAIDRMPAAEIDRLVYDLMAEEIAITANSP